MKTLCGVGKFSLVDMGRSTKDEFIASIFYKDFNIGDVIHNYAKDSFIVDITGMTHFNKGFKSFIKSLQDYIEVGSPFYQALSLEHYWHQAIGELLYNLHLIAKASASVDYDKGYHLFVLHGEHPFKRTSKVNDDLTRDKLFDLSFDSAFLTSSEVDVADTRSREVEKLSGEIVAEAVLSYDINWVLDMEDFIALFELEPVKQLDIKLMFPDYE